MLSRSTWKYLKNIRSYKYQNDEKGQRILIEKCQNSPFFVDISIVIFIRVLLRTIERCSVPKTIIHLFYNSCRVQSADAAR